MSVIFLLIAAGGAVAVLFLGAFAWAVRVGQFDDVTSPAWRALFDATEVVRPQTTQTDADGTGPQMTQTDTGGVRPQTTQTDTDGTGPQR